MTSIPFDIGFDLGLWSFIGGWKFDNKNFNIENLTN
jgi:hypothetical protein